MTGASSGIGEEFARYFAKAGHNLVLVARRRDRLLSICAELSSKYGIETRVINLDLSHPSFMDKLKSNLDDIEISILINNAGFGLNGDVSDLPQEKQNRMVMVNCHAPTVLTNYFIPKMKSAGRGAIIFLGSIVGFQPLPYMSLYSATKAFNLIYGESLWYELRKFGIDVLVVNPGSTKTEFDRISKVESGPMVRTTQDVVKTAMAALGRKPSVIDGMLNKISVFVTRFLPGKVISIIRGSVANKICKKN